MDDGARECARDPFDALDASNHELAEIVDVLRLRTHDHVVRPGHVFRRKHAFDPRRSLRNRRSLADFHGKLVLLYFGFASCPDVCPTDLVAIANLIGLLGPEGDELQPLFVTLDPERDTREVLGAYVAGFHPRFVALSGTEEDTRRVATSYKVAYEKVRLPGAAAYTVDHTAYVFLLDREGRFVTLFPPGTPAERMAVMVREQLATQ